MKLKRLIASAAIAFASFGATVAQAATIENNFSKTWTNVFPGVYVAGFENTIDCPGTNSGCSFKDTYNFTPDLQGVGFGQLLEVLFPKNLFSWSDLDLTKVALIGNGVEHLFALNNTWLTDTDSGWLSGAWVTSPISLVVEGTANKVGAKYGGALELKHASAVPEPGTVALLGLATLGFALSRRRKNSAKAPSFK